MTWYDYTYLNINLSSNFIGLDTNSLLINKETFLSQLIEGNIIPVKLKIADGRPVYKLYELIVRDEDIINTIKQMASIEMSHLKMEGKKLSSFKFTDLEGNMYNELSTQGKLIVLKCWFINCGACVKEFPELNKLVEDNKNFPNVLFLSLAKDSAKDLQKFIIRKEFKYAVVAGMEDYMTNKLHVAIYPTHILINGKGQIIKVVNKIEDLIPLLDKEKIK